MKIKALNEPESFSSYSDETTSEDGRQQELGKEALEDLCFDKYRRALLAIQDHRDNEARHLLEELEDDLDSIEGDDTLIQLKFSVLRNLGNLKTNDINTYVEALAIDSTDISLWIRAGDRASQSDKFNFARLCYEQALKINPKNWIAIDKLIDVFHILHLPFELDDVCHKALALNPHHLKAQLMLEQANKLQPFSDAAEMGIDSAQVVRIVGPLEEAKKRRRNLMQSDLQKFKRAKLSITLDTARIQSLASFGTYIIKVYERFSKQFTTRNTVIDMIINNTPAAVQQITNGSVNSQSLNQNSNEAQNTCSQDVDMAVEGEQANSSENDKSNNRNDPPVLTDENDQTTKSNSRTNRSNQSSQKTSSLSFAAMLFPMDLNDKRRSSRNRSNQEDTYSFKMKFDELNELLPECLRIGAIEQALQRRREEQQANATSNKDDDQEESILSSETHLEPAREDLIIKEVIESLSSQSGAGNINLSMMFRVYLSILSTKKQNNLPEAFAKIYRIYRKLCPLPKDVFIEIGPYGVELDELWFTLTANEITYQAQECMFLLRLLEQLSVYLDETQHKEFLVRLFLILGLNSDSAYLQVALHNIEEDTRVYASNRKIITRAHIKTLIERNKEKVQQEEIVDGSDNPLEVIHRLAPKSENETSDREIQLLCKAIEQSKLWQRGLDILNQRNDLNSDTIIDTINTCLKNGAIMDAILASKLCKEAISGSRPRSWSCLYRGWLGVSTHDSILVEANVSCMTKFFELGHQTLGKKNCCSSDQGEFLMLYVEHLLNEDRDCFEERSLLASMYCLFGYPTKRPASVANHKATKVPMLWEYADIIYSYFTPDDLPTYMSLLRKVGIAGEVVSLLREIADVVPEYLDPKPQVNIIEDFIEKHEPVLHKLKMKKNHVTENLHYYLADYYFKNKDFNTARTFYHYDLVINPDRFDSWAASGLIRASGIDKALSEGSITLENFVSGPFRELVDSAIRCFECATQLKPHEPKATLWIEFGNLTYNLTSLASRLYIYDEFGEDVEERDASKSSLVQEHVASLVKRHKELYELAKNCFKSANELCACDEIWLHYYMLGKIHEKADTIKALEFYSKADSQLYHEGATYPKKISYHNPPDLAYEAMEVHYRIHSAALKFLLTANELSSDTMNQIRRFLLNAQRSPFVELENILDPKESMLRNIPHDVSLLIDDSIDGIESDPNFDELVFMCLHGMKRCLIRCDKNFKALYRLAFYYRKIRDPRMAQDIMLSKDIRTDRRIHQLASTTHRRVPKFMVAPPDLSGVDSLFKDRKIGNLFYNIWRMPVEEIDRPGCFEHWMFKCTWLLIKTCQDLQDTNTLTLIAFQLSRQPETSKKYLQDRPRVLLALFAVKTIIEIIIYEIERAATLDLKQRHIRDGIALADKFIKGNVFVDKMRTLYEQLQAGLIPNLNLDAM